MQDILPEVAHHYVGEAVFVPSPEEYAAALGLKSRGTFYAHGSDFTHKLKAVTGLSVVHNGIVLGEQDSINKDFGLELPKVEAPNSLEPLARQIESLTAVDKRALLARLAIDS